MPDSLGADDFPELTADQFYRRVKLLEAESLVSTFRGRSNKILLDSASGRVLRSFLAVEESNRQAGLQWCIERLRYEMAHGRAEMLQSSLDFSRMEVVQLRNALVKSRRSPWRRIWRRVSQTASGLRALLRRNPEQPQSKAN